MTIELPAKPSFEICVEGIQEMEAAIGAGADRVELCGALSEGGITPSLGTVEGALEKAGSAGVFVMIRPRGGDFLYSEDEFKAMLRDVRHMRSAGAPGIVAGCLNPDGTVDAERMARIVEAAGTMAVTCHRAFDMTRDPEDALEALIRCGVGRVLTTGQRANAAEGVAILRDAIAYARGRMTIMVCGDVEADLLFPGGSTLYPIDYHFGAAATQASPMVFHNRHVTMGKDAVEREYQRRVLDDAIAAERITRLGAAWLRRASQSS